MIAIESVLEKCVSQMKSDTADLTRDMNAQYEEKAVSLKVEYERKLESAKAMLVAKLSAFQAQVCEQQEQAQLQVPRQPTRAHMQNEASKKWSGRRCLQSKASRTDAAALAMILSIDNCPETDCVFVQSDENGRRFFEYPLESCLKRPVRGLLDALLEMRIISSVQLHESGKWRVVFIHSSVSHMKSFIPDKTLYWNGNVSGMFGNADFDVERELTICSSEQSQILSFRLNEQNQYEIFEGRYNGTGHARYKFFVIYKRSGADADSAGLP